MQLKLTSSLLGVFLVVAISTPSVQAQACDLVRIAQTPDPVLADTTLRVGTAAYSYSEIRASTQRTYSDVTKDIALRVLDLDTCQTEVVVISKEYTSPVTTKRTTTYQATLITPSGWTIKPIRRANGIQWNAWATEYEIIYPTRKAVIEVKYPVVENPGKKNQEVTFLTYTPHSSEVRTPEVVTSGVGYLSSVASRAYAELRAQNVYSKAFPKMLVSDIASFNYNHQVRLALIEHLDLTEFILDPSWTLQRLLTVVGLNREGTSGYTCSNASACGLMQFTAPTYKQVYTTYPRANIVKDFSLGARDHLNSMKAAILLHDLNLASLIKVFGTSIASDPNLEEYLAAAYNTGVRRVINVIRAARAKRTNDWAQARGVQGLLAETKGYIAKLRYIVSHPSPMRAVAKGE